MSNDLPPVSADCETSCCEEPDPTGKCYTTKEAIPVCSSLNPASNLFSSDCTRLDNTYDKLLQSFVVPSVGSESTISVCNPSIYTVGSWIEFSDGQPGAKFQVTAVNTIEGYIKVRNSCSDGETAINGNPSPGASIVAGARFIVIGTPVCISLDNRVLNLQEEINAADELCFENISGKVSGQQELKMLGLVSESDLEEGAAQPCLRVLETREARDGSLILGNVDENQLSDNVFLPLFANSDNTVVTGTVETDIQKWLHNTAKVINTHLSDPGTPQEYVISNIPDGATHAIIQVHVFIDDNPAGDIGVKFGNIAPMRCPQSSGESYSVIDISVPIVDGKITYEIYSPSGGGGTSDFSGTTYVELNLIGFEVVTTLPG